MFFGLCNSPATFQAMMNDIFRDMLNEGWLIIYMDDILIYSNDPEEHRRRTLRVLARLCENDLFLKAEKCKFDVKEVEYLGLIISENKSLWTQRNWLEYVIGLHRRTSKEFDRF
jgi:hypothetical protein